jgi:hemerythrin-like metal-binding protein
MPSKDKLLLWQLKWDESLSVGIPEIDVDHQRFILLINGLNEAIANRLGVEEIKNRVLSILEDAAIHFAHEEALFKEWDYPEAVEHAEEHEQMIVAMNEIISRLEHGCTEYVLIESTLYFKAALIEHFLTESMEYRAYYEQNKSLQSEKVG